MPVLYRDTYLRSFHSPPHMRPPMSLQYAVWTTASNGHPRYGRYHDALYRRARHYLEAEELKVGMKPDLVILRADISKGPW